ncbi:uncharacterized protein Z518_10272 [Rhinocladiella mackenziei CBS 650.93]|uniref:ferric-chelate reductase (NADPH) n=1 Tax=Rhinocladiella mackenziei CBS 650.93 TaxID=1442369 RepID=A0A0D2ITS6_9EURO|nr:uncharacterized protein Z518_10272 [Rhinocladiella mackenziei CBS 650.93]KIX00135.1 hypothetical protein Z518_10272 [Rhinocladiella mackenziei CBS 650.93]
MTSIDHILPARHIQNMSEAAYLQPHWGYADRAVPCTNDPGSCAYLDVVYHSHDLGMLYCGILWATVGGVLFIWGIGRHLYPSVRQDQRLSSSVCEGERSDRTGGLHRVKSSIASYKRQYLLPDFLRPVFGRTTRLQVLILLTLTSYLLVWTFVGIVYDKWITPVKDMPEVYNTRTSLGPWSDRVGVLAYALTPLSVMLSSRESLLSLLTGVPYQHFNFLHRWLGYIIFLQSALHTMGWCIIEMRLYQPQPEVGLEWISSIYMIWGVIAMFFLTIIFVLSTPWAIRITGYEFFRKVHYVVAMLYIGACWGHWSKLNCYLIPSLVIWFIDRGARLARTALLHYNYLPSGGVGFRSVSATITHFTDADHGDVVRLDFVHPHGPWDVGQHFYLCLPEVSICQSHPFTPSSLPGNRPDGQVHSYIIRAKKGATRTLADLATMKSITIPDEKKITPVSPVTTPVILSGPYGVSIVSHLQPTTNVQCVAGGSGVTFVLPVLLGLINQAPVADRKLEFIWAIRRDMDLAWIKTELETLRRAGASHNLKIRIFVTRENDATATKQDETPAKSEFHNFAMSSSSSSSSMPKNTSGSRPGSFLICHPTSVEASPKSRHPDLGALVHSFVDSTIRGSTTVYGSGPGGMISDLRRIVAGCNSGAKVWDGNERFDVKLVCDDRLEW